MNTYKTLNVRGAMSARVFTAGAVLLLSGSALFGQAREDVVQMDKYEVTGSFIPYAADAPAVPIRTIGQNEIQMTGVAGDLLELLQKQVPQFVGNSNLGSSNANVSGNSTNGGSKISLRNVATLVLINGRRAAFAPVAATGGYTFVDINSIPVSAVDRIEILSDGASAIYGSDAVSGVVNVILKKDFEGVEVGGGYKFATRSGHWAERSARVIAGVKSGKTSLSVSIEWLKSDPMYQNERPFCADQSGKTLAIPGAALWYDPADPSFMTADWYRAVPGRVPPANTAMTPDQLVAAGYYTGPLSDGELASQFNLAQYVTLLLGNEKTSMTTMFEHEFSPKLKLFGDVLYSRTKTFSQLAGQPITSMPLAAAMVDEWGEAEPGHPQNPFLDAYVLPLNRFVDYPRGYYSTNDSIRLLAGLHGTINESWFWEAAINYNAVDQIYDQTGVINRDLLAASIDNGIINLFAVNQAPGALDSSGIFGRAWQKNRSTLTTFDFRLNGAIENLLPAGPIQFAVGFETRRETLDGKPDEGSYLIHDLNDPYYAQPQTWDGATGGDPYADSRNVFATFLQVRVPIASPHQKIPGLYTLELDGAVRYERYSDTDDPVVPKVLLRYLPFNNQLAFRASYAESFNAPELYALSGPGNVGFTRPISYLERDGGGTIEDADQAMGRTTNNPDLTPEKAKTVNFGVVYSPKAIKGLILEANYFHIKQRNLVAVVDDVEIMQDVELEGAASKYVDRVNFGSFNGPTATAPGQVSAAYDARGGSFSGVCVTSIPENLVETLQSGIDFTARYDMTTSSFGNFGFQATGMWYNRYKIDGGDVISTTSGADMLGGGTVPRWSANALVSWQYDGWSASIYGNYIPKVTIISSDTGNPVGKSDDFYRFDVSAGYTFRKGILKNLTVRVGCNNVFDRMPPRAPAAWSDADADIGTYGCLGRVLYIDASYKF